MNFNNKMTILDHKVTELNSAEDQLKSKTLDLERREDALEKGHEGWGLN